MTFRTLIAGFALFTAAPVWADAGVADDGGLASPDASAGTGGAEQMTQEGDEIGPNGPCSLSRDCERGFACVSGRCKFVGFRQAETGCSTAPGLMMLALAALVVLARRHRA